MAEQDPNWPNLRFITPGEAVQAQASGSTTIIDVRRPDEWDAVHLKGAVHVPLDKFQDQQQLEVVIKETIEKIEGQICLTCWQSQKRGPAAASALLTRLQEQGADVSRICVLKGGMEAVQGDAELKGNLEGPGADGPPPAH